MSSSPPPPGAPPTPPILPDPKALEPEPTDPGANKQAQYFRNGGISGHELPLPPMEHALGDEPPSRARARLRAGGFCLAFFGLGLLLGLYLAPETPKATEARLGTLETALVKREGHIAELEQQLHTSAGVTEGKLRKVDRLRHEREGRRYAASLRRTGAQGAGDLMEWFVHRWNQLLDMPQDDDRTTRRAATLALLIGGMAANINPGDYVPWQAEFLSGQWLGELHFDSDGDGLPGLRSSANTHDGFANVSVCQVAMALNQAARDAQVLMMPEMRCDRPEARMSVFLQGKTFDDALNEFVSAVRSQGFIAVEKQDKGMRLVLVGIKPKPAEL